MRPIIGVLPLHNVEKEIIWINPLYMEGISQAGGLPMLLPLSQRQEDWDAYLRQCDGFVFTGGQDIAPALYGEEKRPTCGYQSHLRDRQEDYMLRRLWDLDKPTLGICRGIQAMNAAWGGTLYQDMPTECPSAVVHRQQKPYELPHHQVTIRQDSMLHGIVGHTRISVNSMHHQAVKLPAPGCTPVAWAEDGLIEAMEVPGKRFMLGVQWHPEHMFRNYASGRAIFAALVNSCIQHTI